MVSLGHCALAHSTTCIVYTQCACSLSLCIYTCMYMCISFMRLTATLGWEVMTSEERLVVSKVDTSRSAPDVQYSLLILSNFTWKIHVYGQEMPPSICRLTTDIPTTMSTAATVSKVLRSLDRSYVCIGNGDDKFQELQRSRNGRLRYGGREGSPVASLTSTVSVKQHVHVVITCYYSSFFHRIRSNSIC